MKVKKIDNYLIIEKGDEEVFNEDLQELICECIDDNGQFVDITQCTENIINILQEHRFFEELSDAEKEDLSEKIFNEIS